MIRGASLFWQRTAGGGGAPVGARRLSASILQRSVGGTEVSGARRLSAPRLASSASWFGSGSSTLLLLRSSAPPASPMTRILVAANNGNHAVRFFGKKPREKVVEEIVEPPPPRFAVVQHGDAYAKAMQGLHGQQLALAQKEGEGKDDPDYDPFLEEEMEEMRKKSESEEAEKVDAAASDEVEEDGEEEDDDDDEQFSPKEEAENQKERDLENDTSALWRINQKVYNNDGSLKRNKSELAILRAGAPAGGKVAIVKLSYSQYKVTTEDVVIVNKLMPTSTYSVGSIHTLKDEDVLLLTSSSLTLVGMPYVPGAEVDFMVEEITQDARVIAFKKRRRKNSKRKKGFRRDVTMLRILDIRYPEPYRNHEHVERPEPAPLVVNPRSKQAIIEYSAKVSAS